MKIPLKNILKSWGRIFFNPVKLLPRAGTEVTVKLRPVKHTTSKGFRQLSIEKRECRYAEEQEVSQQIKASILARFN